MKNLQWSPMLVVNCVYISYSSVLVPVRVCIYNAKRIVFQNKTLCYWAVLWSWFAQVNALCNLSCKKSREVAVSLPGRFLRRRCFTLCITMELKPRIAKQYKCHNSCSCKNWGSRGVVRVLVLTCAFCSVIYSSVCACVCARITQSYNLFSKLCLK